MVGWWWWGVILFSFSNCFLAPLPPKGANVPFLLANSFECIPYCLDDQWNVHESGVGKMRYCLKSSRFIWMACFYYGMVTKPCNLVSSDSSLEI